MSGRAVWVTGLGAVSAAGIGTAALFSLGSIFLQVVAAARGREDTSVALTFAVFGLIVGFLWKQRRDVIGAPPRAS